MGYIRTFLLWVCLLDVSYTVLSGKPEKHVDVTKIWAGMHVYKHLFMLFSGRNECIEFS